MLRRLDEEFLASAMADAAVVERFQAKLVLVPGSECVWWTGAVSGRGHGRFWVGAGQVVIAHRFAYALVHGATSLPALLGHRCDNPLCQRIGEGHVVESTATLNRGEWLARRNVANGPLADPRGSRGRAIALRDLARVDGAAVRDDINRIELLVGYQPPLF